MRGITIKRARTWHDRKMRPCIEPSTGPVSLSPFRSWPDCIINTSGYDFRKGQGSPQGKWKSFCVVSKNEFPLGNSPAPNPRCCGTTSITEYALILLAARIKCLMEFSEGTAKHFGYFAAKQQHPVAARDRC